MDFETYAKVAGTIVVIAGWTLLLGAAAWFIVQEVRASKRH